MKALEQVREVLVKEAAKYLKAVRLIDEINGTAEKVAMAVASKRKGKRTRVLSISARANISAAQRKRWAKWHREQGAKRG